MCISIDNFEVSKGFSLSGAFNSVQCAIMVLLFCEIHFEVLFLFEAITNYFVLFILCILRYNWFSFSLLTVLFLISPLRISYMFWSSLPFFPNNSQILFLTHANLGQKKKKLCQFVLPMDFVRCGLPLTRDLRKTRLSLFQQQTIANSSFARGWYGLGVHSSCACCRHNHRESICAGALQCP